MVGCTGTFDDPGTRPDVGRDTQVEPDAGNADSGDTADAGSDTGSADAGADTSDPDAADADPEDASDDAGDAAPPGLVALRLVNQRMNIVDPRFEELPESVSYVELPLRYSFEANVEPDVQSVRFMVDGSESLDVEAPFRFESGVAREVTTHEIEVALYASADGTGDPVQEHAQSFEVTDAGAPGADHAVERWWVTGSGAYVRRDDAGNFVTPAGEVVIGSGDVRLVEEESQQHHYVADDAAGDTIAFAFIALVPNAFDASVSYPVVVFLHHGGGNYRGTDNDGEPTRTPMFTGSRSLIASENRDTFPALVLVPQMVRIEESGGVREEWAAFTSINNDVGTSNSAPETSRNAQHMLRMLDDVVAGTAPIAGGELQVDAARLYLTGHSMGGLGTWDLIAREPNKWAAAVPMAGYPDHDKAALLVDVPVWAFHHAIDCYNPFVGSETMHRLITEPPNNGQRVQLTPLDFDTGGACDQAHFRTPNAWNDTPDLMPWLFGQVLDR